MPYIGSVLGLVFSNMHDSSITELTKKRTMGSVMFGGRYRLIDFPLSNMVNSGISEVGVITKSNFQSLIDHLGSGSAWDLSRKKGGLHILPPFSNVSQGIYRGRLEALCGISRFIEYSVADYVVMTDCDVVTNMNFTPIIEEHIETGADITVVSNKAEYSKDDTSVATVYETNRNGKVTGVLINPQISGELNLGLNMFVMKKDFLTEIIRHSKARNLLSFSKDILQSKVNQLHIHVYDYQNYFRKIDSLASYYKANLDLLEKEVREELFPRKTPIYTKVCDNAPCKYGEESKVKNSLVADGCTIEGTVENSIIFRGVKVDKGTKISNSILMQDTVVGKKSDVSYLISDKKVRINDYSTLSGAATYPMLLEKGASV